MESSRFTKPLRRIARRMKLGKVALALASFLPLKASCQAIANDLPDGETLIVLPCQIKSQPVARIFAKAKEKRERLMCKELL